MPRFKGPGRFRSFGFRQFSGIVWRNGGLRFKGLPGALRVHLHRPLPAEGEIKCCNCSSDVNGWFVAFVVELPTPACVGNGRAVGIDLGITAFAALSTGEVIPGIRAARRAEGKLKRAHRAVLRKKKGSNGREKAWRVFRRCHAEVYQQRMNHLHQASALLVRQYQIIAVEALPLPALGAGMLRKEVRDASWGRFISMLRYKAENAGARIIAVDHRNTSQDCSGCGVRVPKTLRDRHHYCCNCGLSISRDHNAALNVLIRAGVGPGLRNANRAVKRADGNLDESSAGTACSSHSHQFK